MERDFIGVFGGALALIAGAIGFFAMALGEKGTIFYSILLLLFVLGVYGFINSDKYGRINMDRWLETVSSCPYKYAWDGYGMAIDPYNRKLIVAMPWGDKFFSKVYSFDDIRRWGYEMPGATTLYGNVSFGEGLRQVREHGEAKDNTGFWIEVRDIQTPKWFIKFYSKRVQDKTTEFELTKWMEIFRQQINEGCAKTNFVYCTKCGSQNEYDASFCTKCGSAL